MPVRIDHGTTSAFRAKFLMPGILTDGDNPLEAPAARFVASLARAGWNVPGVTVEILTSGGREAHPVRTVSRVAFGADAGRTVLAFHHSERDGQGTVTAYGLDAAGQGDRRYEFYGDGSGNGWQEVSSKGVADLVAAVEDETRRLDGLPPHPGHDDITEEGDAFIRALARKIPRPVPEGLPVLHAWAPAHDVRRLLAADGNAAEGRSYGIVPDRRLLPLGTETETPYDSRANSGFIFAAENPAHARHPALIFRFPHGSLPVEIRLRDLDGLYVADADAWSIPAPSVHALWTALAEHRFFCIDRDIVTFSPVMHSLTPIDHPLPHGAVWRTPQANPVENRHETRPEIQAELAELAAETAAAMTFPHASIDCAIVDGRPAILEMNPMQLGQIGLYACDVRALARASRKLLPEPAPRAAFTR